MKKLLQKFREPVNGLTHLGAAVAAGAGLGALLYLGRGEIFRQVSLLVYGLSLVLMFAASGIYHTLRARPEILVWLRKLDHSAIYLLIAGTYTPICLHFFEGFWRWGMLAIIWGMALGGITAKLFWINAPRWLTAGIYLLMGWLSVLALREMLLNMPPGALIWLALGGVWFTIGAVIYVLRKPNFIPGVFGFHEVWHIFVILGALSHYILIAAYVAA